MAVSSNYFKAKCLVPDSKIVLTPFVLEDCWSTAVRKAVGYVNPDSQKILGGWAVVAQVASCSTLIIRSFVQDASGFMEGYH